MSRRCPKDGGRMLWEVFGGMRVFRMIGRRKVYRRQCETCGHMTGDTR